MSAPRFAVGIDLGTTHCALARVDLTAVDARSEVLGIEQLVSARELEARPLLASFVYIPPDGEAPLPLPWDEERRWAVGEHARARGPEAPGRVIASAKSWLCHPNADRRAGMLPIAAPDDVEKISPVEASWRYLEHLVEAYDARHAGDGGSLTQQQIVLAVPASFDAAARELTVEAALAAGLEDLTLLEEPQAALYAWLEQKGDGWRKELGAGDMVLVVDVGGGTTDLSAIEARDVSGELELVRVAVGDHLLLGGDNMDLALAHAVKRHVEVDGVELDGWQMASLTHAARSAKEQLLSSERASSVAIVVPRRGSKLVGGAIRSKVTRAELSELLLDGFFPEVAKDERPAARPRAGLTQIGLPYAADPAITKHLAAFLHRQASAARGGGAMLRPTRVLFNGGVMKSAIIRERLSHALGAWLEADGASPARELEGGDLDVAVARGAAYYGRARRGHAVRIRGGTARAYYVGFESAQPAVPGIEPPMTLMCVAPFGMEEGTAAKLPPHQLAVVVGEPVRFRFFGSSVRRHDAAGVTLERYDKTEIAELPPIEITLPADDRAEGDVVPVELRSSVTEVGTLELQALPIEPKRDDERWKVELSVRESAAIKTVP